MRAPFPSWTEVRRIAAEALMQGISPRRLALTIALGFVLGCLPLVGIPTALCVLVAFAFRLNQPMIQVANYAALPFQMVLVVPFARLGGKLMPGFLQSKLDLGVLAHLTLRTITHSSTQVLGQVGILAGQALLAWLLVAIPVATLLTFALTRVLRRVPTLEAAQSGD